MPMRGDAVDPHVAMQVCVSTGALFYFGRVTHCVARPLAHLTRGVLGINISNTAIIA